tara:strand:- start:290 stop:454 length:165 start_codon:yes stop_codon:yes gene_type:complete
MENTTIEQKLEAIKEDMIKKHLQRIYDQLETITQDELDMDLEEFLEWHKLINKA